ncbi:MAG: nucleoside-diphosphate kinase [Acidobacteriota bacterium]
MPTEKTFIMIKPDGIQRGLAGGIISKFEKKGLKIVAMKMMTLTKERAEKHYAEHQGKGFYGSLIEFITSGPVIAFILEGPKAISIVRKLVGATNPADADPGTIRGDYVLYTTFNIIHASDSPESAGREIKLFFANEEIQSYNLRLEDFIFEA